MSATSRCERLFGRIERLPSTRCERKIALARVFFRGFARNQAASFEIAQHAAQISGIEVERAADILGGHRLAVGDLVKHPHLAEGVRTVEVSLAQDADLARVEPVEAPYGADPCISILGIFGLSGAGHGTDEPQQVS